jgi:hypothetical protein
MRVENLNFAKFATYMVLVVGLSASALASCGDSLSAMAAGAAAGFQSLLKNRKRSAPRS